MIDEGKTSYELSWKVKVMIKRKKKKRQNNSNMYRFVQGGKYDGRKGHGLGVDIEVDSILE